MSQTLLLSILTLQLLNSSFSPQEILAEHLSSAGTSPPAINRDKRAASWHEQKKKKRSGGGK